MDFFSIEKDASHNPYAAHADATAPCLPRVRCASILRRRQCVHLPLARM